MKKIILFLVFVFTLSGFSQSKYFIYFKDKGVEATENLNKNSTLYKSAVTLLSEKSIERRIKNMGEENFITYEDFPLKEE